MNKKASKQAGVSPRSGTAPPVHTRFGQPGANPRHSGAWKKEDSARYKLEQMMKLKPEELEEVKTDPERPMFEQKLATAMLDGQWKEIESMINQVYGAPRQQIDAKVENVVPIMGGESVSEDDSN